MHHVTHKQHKLKVKLSGIGGVLQSMKLSSRLTFKDKCLHAELFHKSGKQEQQSAASVIVIFVCAGLLVQVVQLKDCDVSSFHELIKLLHYSLSAELGVAKFS
jgi:hypothetical protein